MIKLIKGNLLDSSANIICHGVNCEGGFGSGIAGQIAKKWPAVREAYIRKFNEIGWILGEVQYVFLPEDKCIVNMATQYSFGYGGGLYANYEAIEKCLNVVFKFANDNNRSVALPEVGCGLGGAEWHLVDYIIREVSLKYPNVSAGVYSL